MEFKRPKKLKVVKFPRGDYDTWTKKERSMMEAHAAIWASEYVKDFDAYETAVRLGFEGDEIKPAIRRYMSHWLVASYIQQLQERFEEENIATRSRLLALAFRDASNYSPRADPRARVAAQKTVASLLGIDIDGKNKGPNVTVAVGGGELNGTGGVMIVPHIPMDEWREKAAQSQRQLKEDVRK